MVMTIAHVGVRGHQNLIFFDFDNSHTGIRGYQRFLPIDTWIGIVSPPFAHLPLS
jgi:hypothetical protein